MASKPKIRRDSVDPTGEFPFAPDDYLLHLLAAVHQFRDSALDAALRPLGLNVGRYRVMSALNRFGDCTMNEVAAFTAMERTTLTRISDQLVAAAYVDRIEDPKDRRHVLLRLTESGKTAFEAALVVVININSRLVAGVSEMDSRTAARALKTIVANLAPTPAARVGIVEFSRNIPPDKAKKGPVQS
jgi:DNA-binding MarR family transcriptional regulator